MSAEVVSVVTPPLDVERRRDGALVLRLRADWSEDHGCVHDWLSEWAGRAPQRMFLHQRSGEHAGWDGVTYADAYRQATALAAALRGIDLGPQRPIVILSGNSIAHQLLSLAAMMAGVPFAPVSVAYSTVSGALPKLQFVLATLNPGLVYAEDGHQFHNALTMPEMAGRVLVVGRRAEAVPGTLSLDELAAAAPAVLALPKASPDATIKWIFTSGSTGQPKAVITTHRMIRNDVLAIARILGIVPGEMTAIDWLPWSHVYGGSFGVGMTLRNGGTLYIDDGRPMAPDFARTVRNLRGLSPTLFWNVPKAYEHLVQALSDDPALCRSFFAKLSAMIYGAASLPKSVFDAMNDLVARYAPRQIPMIPSWGMTETTTIATIATASPSVPTAIGIPLPGVTLKLVPSGDKFEARIKGPIVTPGYWRRPDATADAIDDEGYLRTGDALRLLDESRPNLGLVFEGRIAEDFKLLSGTWVNVTEVRSRYLAALANLAADVVVAGPDRDDLALLIFPSKLAGGSDVTAFRNALAMANAGQSGTSRVIARAVIVEQAPNASAGEITEKGSLNARRILENRRALVDRVYDGTADGMVLQPQMSDR